MKFCNNFWLSHGCDLEPGHEGNHACIIKYDSDEGFVQEVCCEHDGRFMISPNGHKSAVELFAI